MLGKRMAAALFPGAFIALYGELGAGKTAFVRGVAAGLGIDAICSPTFNIVQEHIGRLPLYHFDAYRLENGQALYAIGFDEYVNAKGVLMLEWPENVADALPDSRLDITVTGSGDQPRMFEWLARDERHEALIAAISCPAERRA